MRPVGAQLLRLRSLAAARASDNVAGALAYITIVGLIFILIEPYNKNKFVRFHAFQSLFFAASLFVGWFAMMVLLLFPSWAGCCALIGIGFFITWILLIIKAYQGNKFKLPVIGDLAEKQAGV